MTKFSYAFTLSCTLTLAAPGHSFANPSADLSPEKPAPISKEENSAGTFRELLSNWSRWLPSSSDEGAGGDNSGDLPPAALESEPGNLLSSEDLLSDEELKKALPWRPPNFSGQDEALGLGPRVFETPKGIEARVAFWRDIYTQYTSDQGVLHDRTLVDLVYEQIDFAPIMTSPGKSDAQKARLREKLVKERRNEVVARLKRLEAVKSPAGLTPADLRLWKMLEKINNPNKFQVLADNSRVRFQLGQRDRFIIGIYHSGRYLAEMERIFREEKLPVELTRLPFVESSFNLRARSRVGASGIWQFMPRTARPFLKINRDVDERNDPIKATKASARLLKQNYSMLQSWPLAITAYNHGSYGVKKVVEKTGTRDIAVIVNTYSSRRFGFASENFYACFLAALEAERDAKKYFGDVRWGPELGAVELRLTKAVPYKTLIEFFDGDAALTELANPHLLKRVRDGKTSLPSGIYVRVPPTRLKLAELFLSGKMPPAKLALALKEAPLPGDVPAPTSPQFGSPPQ